MFSMLRAYEIVHKAAFVSTSAWQLWLRYYASDASNTSPMAMELPTIVSVGSVTDNADNVTWKVLFESLVLVWMEAWTKNCQAPVGCVVRITFLMRRNSHNKLPQDLWDNLACR